MKKEEETLNYNLITINEGSTKFYIHEFDQNSTPSKSMEVFYNKRMEINRDISNLAIMAYNKLINQCPLIIIDSMAASGISSIRILKECNNIEKIYINDLNPYAVDLIHKNLKLNNIFEHSTQIEVSEKDANILFSEIAEKIHLNKKNEYKIPNIISIDPFGTPNLYLDSAFKTIQKVNGLLCVTATDTPVLFGIKNDACIRKYMAKSLHTEYCKEIGARILLNFISRIANINGLGILPLLTFYSSHFIRVFCITFKNRKKISEFFNKYGYIVHCDKCGYRASFRANVLKLPKKCPNCLKKETIDYAGPLWVDDIHHLEFIKELITINEKLNYNNKKRIEKLLTIVKDEVNMPITYYNVHRLSQELKVSTVPKLKTVINCIKNKGYRTSRTHFDFLSIKSFMDINGIKKCILELQ